MRELARSSVTVQSSAHRTCPARFAGLFLLALPTFWPAMAQRGEQEVVEIVEEKATGVAFATVMPAPGAAQDSLHLIGTTVREKTIFNVDVYAYGVYVEPYGAQAALAETYRWREASELGKSDSFFRAALNGEFTKSLRMVFVRKVDGEDVRKAFGSDLPPRMARAQAAHPDWPKSDEAFATFQTYFEVDKLVEDSELVLTWHPDGRVSTRVLGEVKPDLIAPALGWAIFDLFLGDEPLEKGKRKHMAARVPYVLNLELPERPQPQDRQTEDPKPEGQQPDKQPDQQSPDGSRPQAPLR